MTGANSPLPAVLRLPPHGSVLDRGARSRLLGLHPDRALTVNDLSPALAGMLDELAAPADRAGLVERAVRRGAPAADAEALLRRLVDAGVVVDAEPERLRARRRSAATVVVRGSGPLTAGLVVGLVRAGIGAVHVETEGTVVAADLGTALVDDDRGRRRGAAVQGAVRRLAPSRQVGPPPMRLVPDLVVLTDASLPDPTRVGALVRDGVAHLLVRLRDGSGVVGPLVLPGRSACLACLELHRCSRDPEWPAVAAQLVGSPGSADPECVVMTVGLGTAQAVAAVDGPGAGDNPPPPVVDAALEIDPRSGTIVRRPWRPRADCPCRAAAAPGRDQATCAPGSGRETIVR
jgi:bacteriocin biosynthesis cyclodehydratase domain-containing protein